MDEGSARNIAKIKTTERRKKKLIRYQSYNNIYEIFGVLSVILVPRTFIAEQIVVRQCHRIMESALSLCLYHLCVVLCIHNSRLKARLSLWF